jgi:hypothetical protein
MPWWASSCQLQWGHKTEDVDNPLVQSAEQMLLYISCTSFCSSFLPSLLPKQNPEIWSSKLRLGNRISTNLFTRIICRLLWHHVKVPYNIIDSMRVHLTKFFRRCASSEWTMTLSKVRGRYLSTHNIFTSSKHTHAHTNTHNSLPLSLWAWPNVRNWSRMYAVRDKRWGSFSLLRLLVSSDANFVSGTTLQCRSALLKPTSTRNSVRRPIFEVDTDSS